jgi:hypothetical protein
MYISLTVINLAAIPADYKLFQSYPNPFNPWTTIRFQLPKKSLVHLSIYNMLGAEVDMLVSEILEAGFYKADWDASGFPSGVYFYRIKTGDFTDSKKMVLMK